MYSLLPLELMSYIVLHILMQGRLQVWMVVGLALKATYMEDMSAL